MACHNQGFMQVGIYTIVLPGTAAKINCSLFVQKHKGVCTAENEDWLCFYQKIVGQAPKK